MGLIWKRNLRAHSSVGQSSRLITERSLVQVQVGPPEIALAGKGDMGMETSTPLQSFIELANFDQAMNQIRQHIKQAESEANLVLTSLTKLKLQHEQDQQALHKFEKNVREHELVMQGLDEDLQRQKKLIEQNLSPKEYNAIKNSISTIKKEQHNYETVLMEEWHKLDLAKKTFREQHQKWLDETALLESQIPVKNLEIDNLKQQLVTQTQARQAYLSKLPHEWLERYEAMYTKVSNPIVQLINNACSACFQDATSQVIIDLKHHKLVQCKGCFRFLFF